MKAELASVAKLQKACDKAKAEFTAFERRDIKHKEVTVLFLWSCPRGGTVTNTDPWPLGQEKKFLKNKIKKLGATVEKDTKSLNEQTSKDSALVDDQQRWASELSQAQAELQTAEADLETLLASLQTEMATQQGALSTCQQALAPFSQQRAEAQAALELKQNELALATKSVRDVVQQAEAATQGLSEVCGELPCDVACSHADGMVCL